MMWHLPRHLRAVTSAVVVSVLSLPLFAADPPAAAPSPDAKPALGLKDPGKLIGIRFEGLPGASEQAAAAVNTIRGREGRRQLIVTAAFESGQTRDFTRKVTYEIAPAGILSVDPSGMVVPQADGKAMVTAKTPAGLTAQTELTVANIAQEIPVNFPNEVVPIFTKLSCNSGGCHGKASGQNGFRLSLLGFEPGEDYEHLVKESRGRRLFPAAPDRSLLLVKGANTVPHGGGTRLEPGALEYQIIRRWIAQGMPPGDSKAPIVTKITVIPDQRTMPLRGEQQLAVLATFSDGGVADISAMSQFTANNGEMAEISKSGLVKTTDLTGGVAIMARYQTHVGVFRANVPLGAPVDKTPPEKNFIDTIVFAKLKNLGVPPSALCNDSTFIRRVTVDVAGRLPTLEETKAFLDDKDPAKREKWVDRLLASAEYADFFANKWSAILRNKRQNESYAHGSYIFHDWIRTSLYENKPYDEFAREILAASGEVGDNPPVVWYREVKEVNQQVEDTAQLFLGLRIQCARCHHHPFEKWSQRDYYGFSAFFSRIGRKPGLEASEQRIFHQRGQAAATNPKTGESLKPTGLDGPALELPPDQDPRQALVDWMAAPDNPFFSTALVNRYWKHFFMQGLVDPEDDMRVTNPPTNPELLKALSKHFIDGKFDLKGLIRAICLSSTYQLDWEPNEFNARDKQSFARYYPKRLNAEVLLDAINQVTGSTSKFTGMPQGVRAVQLPDTGFDSYFLTVFGRPESMSACECERSQEANLAQSLHLLNSSEIQGKLSAGGGRAATLANDKTRPDEEKLRDLYLGFYSRPPTPDEMATLKAYLDKRSDKRAPAYEDILWALINTKEFLFNH